MRERDIAGRDAGSPDFQIRGLATWRREQRASRERRGGFWMRQHGQHQGSEAQRRCDSRPHGEGARVATALRNDKEWLEARRRRRKLERVLVWCLLSRRSKTAGRGRRAKLVDRRALHLPCAPRHHIRIFCPQPSFRPHCTSARPRNTRRLQSPQATGSCLSTAVARFGVRANRKYPAISRLPHHPHNNHSHPFSHHGGHN